PKEMLFRRRRVGRDGDRSPCQAEQGAVVAADPGGYRARMTVLTRFAPSPTGQLHVGNIRTALHNWLWARKSGGRFMLRIDDTDAERSEERFVDAIRADLAWLGLVPDGEARQSARFALYEARFAALRDAGHVYPAYQTAQ